ncbi:transcription termination factor Rho, partial [Streptomyces sp. NPDC045251]
MTTTLEHPPAHQSPAETVSGVLDIDAGGKGHLRGPSLRPEPADLSVSPALIRRHGLRRGDLVEGVRGDRRALADVVRVGGRAPDR